MANLQQESSQTRQYFNQVAIIGMGLLGSSIAAFLKKNCRDVRITGISSPGSIKKGLDLHLLDEGTGYENMSEAVGGADLVLFSTPISHIIASLKAWQANPPHFQPGCIVTDVGSTKTVICQTAEKIFKNHSHACFIGSHPMAGSEKHGMAARDPHLFENSSWIICPLKSSPPSALKKLKAWIRLLGANPIEIPAENHDEIVAHVSHLPQLLASALAGFIAGKDSIMENCLQVAGGGFRDMTRLASSSFDVWEPIFQSNQSSVNNTLSGFIVYLETLKNLFEKEGFRDLFKQGNALREKLLQRKRGLTSELAELLLTLPDKPGVLVRALQPLAEREINVLDIEILRVREGESGTIRLGFKKPEDVVKADKVLTANGFEVKIR